MFTSHFFTGLHTQNLPNQFFLVKGYRFLQFEIQDLQLLFEKDFHIEGVYGWQALDLHREVVVKGEFQVES